MSNDFHDIENLRELAEFVEIETPATQVLRVLERARKVIDLETLICYDFDLCTSTFTDIIEPAVSKSQRIDATRVAWIKTHLLANLMMAKNDSMLTPFEKYDLAHSIAISTFILYITALSNPEFRSNMIVLATLSGYGKPEERDTVKLARILCSLFHQQFDTPDTWLQRVKSISEIVINAVATAISLKGVLEHRVI